VTGPTSNEVKFDDEGLRYHPIQWWYTNSEDDVGVRGNDLHVRGHTEQKKSNPGDKGNNNQRGRSKSKGPPGDLFCRYCKKKKHLIENCRIRRRGTACSSQRVKLTVVHCWMSFDNFYIIENWTSLIICSCYQNSPPSHHNTLRILLVQIFCITFWCCHQLPKGGDWSI
jgi:hypothetical protein